jgi:hypothetical protein
MVPADVAPALVVVEPQLLFQILIVPLDAPAAVRERYDLLEGRWLVKPDKPVLSRRRLGLGSLD